VEEGHISTARCILANVAMQTGETLRDDPQRREIPGSKRANALLRRACRKPWKRPEPLG
jgi:hypothetical protein